VNSTIFYIFTSSTNLNIHSKAAFNGELCFCAQHLLSVFSYTSQISLLECCSCAQALVFWVFIHSTNYITVHFTAAPKKILNHHHHGEHCKSKTDSQHWRQGEKKHHPREGEE
jgi:hypothetical protein